MVYHSTLDITFFALADPTRREILSRLATGDRTISELAERFDMTLPAVSKHVRMLQRAGLASVEQRGRVRHARLTPAPMRSALEWIERYRRYWESELEQLAAYLEATTPTEPTSWPNQQPPTPTPTAKPSAPRSNRPSSKSGASSARRASASSTRGRKKRS